MSFQLIVITFLFYSTFAFTFYFILNQKAKIIDMIIKSKKPNKRNELINEKNESQKDLIISFLWPLLLFREIKNATKRKK